MAGTTVCPYVLTEGRQQPSLQRWIPAEGGQCATESCSSTPPQGAFILTRKLPKVLGPSRKITKNRPIPSGCCCARWNQGPTLFTRVEYCTVLAQEWKYSHGRSHIFHTQQHKIEQKRLMDCFPAQVTHFSFDKCEEPETATTDLTPT